MIQATTSDGFLLGLESQMRRSGQGHHLSATVIELDTSPAGDALQRAAKALAQRHPLLNARIRRHPVTFLAEWVPGPASPLPVTEHPQQELDHLIEELLSSSSIDIRRNGPNLEMHSLPMENGRHGIVLLWPHSLFDGIGIDKLIQELDSDDTAPRKDWGETHKITETSPGKLWKGAHPMIEEMRTFPAHPIRSLHEKKQEIGKPRFEVFRFDREQSHRIRSHMAETAGELLLIPYFASLSARAVAAVISKRHPDDQTPILLTLPIQRVSNPDKRPLFQNHMVAWSLLLQDEQLQELVPATKALYREYASYMRRKLPAAMEALTKLNERCPSCFYLLPIKHYLNGEICSLFHSHTGELAVSKTSLFGQTILNAWHVPSVSSPPGIGVFFSEKDGQITCTISWREGSLENDELSILRNRLLTDLGITS